MFRINERNTNIFSFAFKMNRKFIILIKKNYKILAYLLYVKTIYHISMSHIFLQYYSSFGLRFYSSPLGLYFNILKFTEISEFLTLFQNCNLCERLVFDQTLLRNFCMLTNISFDNDSWSTPYIKKRTYFTSFFKKNHLNWLYFIKLQVRRKRQRTFSKPFYIGKKISSHPSIVKTFFDISQFDFLMKLTLTLISSHNFSLRKTLMSETNYVKYLENNFDYDPLYVFMPLSDFISYNLSSKTLDFLEFGLRTIIPQKWIIKGPRGSGSSFHTDSFGCFSWSLVFQGKKIWTFYPPECIPPGMRTKKNEGICIYQSPSPSIWHINFYKEVKPFFFTQHETEAIYIPSGFWHSTTNIEFSTSCTTNHYSFDYSRRIIFHLQKMNNVNLVTKINDWILTDCF